MEAQINAKNKSIRDSAVHFILSHSYLMYLYTITIGIILDIIFPMSVFSGQMYQYAGAIIIIFGTILVFWANKTAISFHKMDLENRDFYRGPYKYTRNPAHIGLSLMTLGLGLIFNSVFIVFLVILSFTIAKMFFLPKEEMLLEKKYGYKYSHYKSMFKA